MDRIESPIRTVYFFPGLFGSTTASWEAAETFGGILCPSGIVAIEVKGVENQLKR